MTQVAKSLQFAGLGIVTPLLFGIMLSYLPAGNAAVEPLAASLTTLTGAFITLMVGSFMKEDPPKDCPHCGKGLGRPTRTTRTKTKTTGG